MSSNPPDLETIRTAARRLSMAAAAAERGEQKAAETSALVSIAASLQQISDLMTPRRENLTVLPEVGMIEGGCCGAHNAAEAGDLLEIAFGLICSVDEGTNVPREFPNQRDEWVQAARRFISGYNAWIFAEYGNRGAASGSQAVLDAAIAEARREAAALKKHLMSKAKDLAAEIDERSAD